MEPSATSAKKDSVVFLAVGGSVLLVCAAIVVVMNLSPAESPIDGDRSSALASSASSLVQSGSVASLITSSSSTSAASSTAPVTVAPFDGCPGIMKYEDRPWFQTMSNAAYEREIYVDVMNTHEACASTDYFVALVEHGGVWTSTVVRYDLRTNVLSPKPSGMQLIAADRFGKREGTRIPLYLQSCLNGYYDVVDNAIISTGKRCEVSSICTLNRAVLDNGAEVYPIKDKYAHLRFLGQIFTADDCGPPRLTQVAGGADAMYELGSAISFNTLPSDELSRTLKSIGYKCSDGGDCRRWELRATVRVSDLLKLKPYSAEITGDDCIHCG